MARPRLILYADINAFEIGGAPLWLAAMARILARLGEVILILQRDPETPAALEALGLPLSVHVLRPADLGRPGSRLRAPLATEVMAALDEALAIDWVVVRGVEPAAALHADTRFSGRSLLYLTDFYHQDASRATIPEQIRQRLAPALATCGGLLTQTPPIARLLQTLAPTVPRWIAMPPPIPDDLPQAPPASGALRGHTLRLGYAGKVAPDWGVLELLRWSRELTDRGLALEVHVIWGRLSIHGPDGPEPDLARALEALLALPFVHVHLPMPRAAAMETMARMDLIWCWRPARLEEATLEFSTKLAEMLAVGCRCLAYPSPVNRLMLGDDYPFFLRDLDDLHRVLATPAPPPNELSMRIRQTHSEQALAQRLADALGLDLPKTTP